MKASVFLLQELIDEALEKPNVEEAEENDVDKRRINRMSAWNKLPPSVMEIAGKRMRKLPPSVLFARH